MHLFFFFVDLDVNAPTLSSGFDGWLLLRDVGFNFLFLTQSRRGRRAAEDFSLGDAPSPRFRFAGLCDSASSAALRQEFHHSTGEGLHSRANKL